MSLSSRTDLYDDVVDVTSFSALDVVEIKDIVYVLDDRVSVLQTGLTSGKVKLEWYKESGKIW